jgi:uncharacterized protein
VAVAREEVAFDLGDARCAASLYLPDEGTRSHACVILAHGFCGTREARLWAYAERFSAAGIAALAFDYRHFGASGGEPRQLLSIRRQQDDWRAAIAFARAHPELDSDRLALWGTSLSGGHVVVVGSEDVRLRAIVASPVRRRSRDAARDRPAGGLAADPGRHP